jgi:tRNA G18 (ribose-2'-O)-methylase SpoU
MNSDPLLDTRNVIDKYKGWTNEAIVADLDTKRFAFHIAIENYQHDFNIGTIVRNANAFNVGMVHIIGKRQWNKRGAMVTDRYLHVMYHHSVEAFKTWVDEAKLHVIGVDNIENSINLSDAKLPEKSVLVMGQEGPGLSPELQTICEMIVAIEQFGSTRSVNVGVASGIMMYAWLQQNVLGK